jgi:integrase
VLCYRVKGRQRQLTIGAFPTWQIAAARTRARELRRLVDQGIDPLEQEAKALAEAMTLAEFWERAYEPLHVTTKRSGRDIRSMLRNDILLRLGDRAVKDIDYDDAAALHRHISKRAPGRANRVLATLSHMMNFAERPHILENGERIEALRSPQSNPCRGVAKNPEERRERFLSPTEMARLAAVLERRPERVSVALTRFLLLTGCRFSEAACATWDQFDLERGTWTKPSSHTKQKKTHVVPLSAPVLMLVQELCAQNGSGEPHLFPGPTRQPITSIKTFWRSVTKQSGLEGVRVHDLRHSFASVLASGGAGLVLIGQLLGHTQAATTQRYSHLVDSVQREAVERAGAVITGRSRGSVVRFGR